MTAKVTQIYRKPAVSKEAVEALMAFDTALGEAIDTAQDAGAPLALIVAILHTHDLVRTLQLVDDGEDDED